MDRDHIMAVPYYVAAGAVGEPVPALNFILKSGMPIHLQRTAGKQLPMERAQHPGAARFHDLLRIAGVQFSSGEFPIGDREV
jgi:hypothetical protein